jgi:hypothetical protein
LIDQSTRNPFLIKGKVKPMLRYPARLLASLVVVGVVFVLTGCDSAKKGEPKVEGNNAPNVQEKTGKSGPKGNAE